MKKILFISSMVNGSQTGGAVVSKRNLRCVESVFGKDNVTTISLTAFSSLKKTPRTLIYKLCDLFRLRMNGLTAISEKQIIEIIRSEKIDEVFIDSSLLGRLIRIIKKTFDIPVYAFFHNCEYSLILQSSLNKHLISLFRIIPAYMNEKLTCSYGDRLICLNNRDANLLEKIYKRRVDGVIPVSLEDCEPSLNCHKVPQCKNILFIGSKFSPNIQGINWFIKKVLPYVNARLVIVGKGISNHDFVECEKVKVYPNVPDLTAFYNEADIVVAPLFYGGGMKVKVAEALMYGKVILATKEAIQGYENIDTVILCESKDDFINTINHFNGSSLSDISRSVFSERYSNDAAVVGLKTILR